MNIIYTTASTTEELLQILSLQRMNLKSSISAEEMNQEGFVTVEHDLDLLKRMNNACPHIIAKDIQNYITMGQICISKSHRKIGLFKGLYEAMKRSLYPKYEYIITEVDATNTRSLNAHLSTGFEKLCTYHSLGQDWELISLKTS